MSMKPTTSTTAPAFEAEGAAQTASTSGAVATKPVAALTVVSKDQMAAVVNLQDAMRVEWDTHLQLTVDKSSLKEKSTKTSVGEWVDLELLSWQHTWVCSPKDDGAEAEVVKYSDDGVTTKDGLSVADYMTTLREDYPDAKLEKRVIIVGGVEAAEKGKHLIGTLVQITLAPTSVTEFTRYMQNSMYAISKGKLDPAVANHIRVSAAEAQGKGSKTYPVAKFSAAPAA